MHVGVTQLRHRLGSAGGVAQPTTERPQTRTPTGSDSNNHCFNVYLLKPNTVASVVLRAFTLHHQVNHSFNGQTEGYRATIVSFRLGVWRGIYRSFDPHGGIAGCYSLVVPGTTLSGQWSAVTTIPADRVFSG